MFYCRFCGALAQLLLLVIWGAKQETVPSDMNAPTKIQVSLHIRTVESECSLPTRRNFASLASQNAHSEDSDQTAWMHKLIWIFAGYICLKVYLLMLCSYVFIHQLYCPSRWLMGIMKRRRAFLFFSSTHCKPYTASMTDYPQHMFSWRNKKKYFVDTSSYL